MKKNQDTQRRLEDALRGQQQRAAQSVAQRSQDPQPRFEDALRGRGQNVTQDPRPRREEALRDPRIRVTQSVTWGVKILTGPDMWWFGNDRGPFTMDQTTAERVASLMNIRSNEFYFVIKAYRSKVAVIGEHTNPRASHDGPPPLGSREHGEIFGRNLPHYRYAAAPLHRAPPNHPGPEVRRLLLPEADRPGHNPGHQAHKRPDPRRRSG